MNVNSRAMSGLKINKGGGGVGGGGGGVVFFFNDTATTEIYTLSLHDALPIFLSLYGMRYLILIYCIQ